jgi:hypothetical protein
MVSCTPPVPVQNSTLCSIPRSGCIRRARTQESYSEKHLTLNIRLIYESNIGDL